MMLLDAASVHFNSVHSVGTKPTADKSTIYVYLMPHCHVLTLQGALFDAETGLVKLRCAVMCI